MRAFRRFPYLGFAWAWNRSWPPNRWRAVRALIIAPTIILAPLATILLGFWEGSAETTCEEHALVCGIFANASVAVMAFIIGYLWIVIAVRYYVVHHYLKSARDSPGSIFPRAPTDPPEGYADSRSENYERIDSWMEQSVPRRGIGGGILAHARIDQGGGGTTFLTGLAEHLARNEGLLPVAIELSEVTEAPVHIERIARARFLREVDAMLRSDAQGDRLWRRLLREREVVILIDGLDEALLDRRPSERAEAMEVALREADENGLIMVATASSAPPAYASLCLESFTPDPLSPDEIRGYLGKHTAQPDSERIERATAWAMSSPARSNPVYLRMIARGDVEPAPDTGELEDEQALARLIDSYVERNLRSARALADLELAARIMLDSHVAVLGPEQLAQHEQGEHLNLLRAASVAEELGLGSMFQRGGTTSLRFASEPIRLYFAAREAMQRPGDVLRDDGVREEYAERLDRIQEALRGARAQAGT